MRAHVIGLLAEPFAAIYADLAGAGEQVTLTYAPSFDEVLMFDDPHPQISEHFQRSPNVAGQPLSPATDRRLGGPLPHQLANQTRGHLSAINL